MKREGGDKFWGMTTPSNQINKRVSQKMSKLFFGPFKIIKRVGEVAYMLDLPYLRVCTRLSMFVYLNLIMETTPIRIFAPPIYMTTFVFV